MLDPPVFVVFCRQALSWCGWWKLMWVLYCFGICLFFFTRQNRLKKSFVSSSFLLMACFLVGDSSALIMNKLKCPHCNYVAKYRRTLKRHLLIHTGVRSFSCDICGKLFTRREHVKRHSLVGSINVCVQCVCTSGVFTYICCSVNKLEEDIYLFNNWLSLFLGKCSIKKRWGKMSR